MRILIVPYIYSILILKHVLRALAALQSDLLQRVRVTIVQSLLSTHRLIASTNSDVVTFRYYALFSNNSK